MIEAVRRRRDGSALLDQREAGQMRRDSRAWPAAQTFHSGVTSIREAAIKVKPVQCRGAQSRSQAMRRCSPSCPPIIGQTIRFGQE